MAAFIGVNGSGKSTVLEAVAVCLIHFVELYTDVQGQSMFKFGVKDINAEGIKTTMTIGLNNQTLHGETLINHTENTNGQSAVGTRNSKDLTDSLSTAIRGSDKKIPVFAHYHNLTIDPHKLKPSKAGRLDGDRVEAYEDAFSSTISLSDSIEFYTKLVNLQNAKAV